MNLQNKFDKYGTNSKLLVKYFTGIELKIIALKQKQEEIIKGSFENEYHRKREKDKSEQQQQRNNTKWKKNFHEKKR